MPFSWYCERPYDFRHLCQWEHADRFPFGLRRRKSSGSGNTGIWTNWRGGTRRSVRLGLGTNEATVGQVRRCARRLDFDGECRRGSSVNRPQATVLQIQRLRMRSAPSCKESGYDIYCMMPLFLLAHRRNGKKTSPNNSQLGGIVPTTVSCRNCGLAPWNGNKF